jgi:hypothetical protein
MPARYELISARSLARPSGIVDPWLLGRFGLNLYRGCEHACAYCEGRAERYRVPGDFAADIQVKQNAPELLERELARVREPGFVLLGGGVCDAYQPAGGAGSSSHGERSSSCTRGACPPRPHQVRAGGARPRSLVAHQPAQRAILSFS